MAEQVEDVGGEDGAVDQAADAAVPERALPTDELLRGIAEPVASATAAADGVIRVDKADLAALASGARDAGFEMCVDVTCVDYHRARRTRYELVVNLISHEHNRRLRILAAVPADDMTAPSLVHVYPGTNFFEREAYDMFGVTFDGHPDMTRILMPDDWVGHPLRKDEGVGSVPVQFKESHQVS